MKLRVRHELRYNYSAMVSLEPHTLYLYPRIYPHQRLLDYQLSIDPVPGKQVLNVDSEGNVQQLVYINAQTDSLVIRADMEVESDLYNAYDFVLFPFETQRIPFNYTDADRKLLEPYLERSAVTTLIEQYARQIASEAKWQTVPFLSHLCTTIRNNFVYETRREGAATSAEMTLINRKGSCRDYAVLYIAACRSIGLAARFVSGYLYGNPQQEHELHAWAEVYLPGAGWRGFDPTEGSVVINHHVSLAASFFHDRLAPVAGIFRGTARSTMTATVSITGAE
ncbi:transglutaminase family protein [Larkinella arboricola]|uniref:Transglutaminase-like putative cysteine protease n=1 Tax=Larkinella arboricola TaxID=643671 RepID=A0A327WU35_LARAB|nr:transglutaminase family protein [Larkinella arboricola]RAJ95854.1 transglutaminase-like putative cysteine protease [Larkinella arboricola]